MKMDTPINLKYVITVELVLLHRYGIITTLLSSKYASHFLAQRKPNGHRCLLPNLRKIKNPMLARCRIQKNLWSGRSSFVISSAPTHTIVCKSRTTSQKRCWFSFLHTDVLIKGSAVHCLDSHQF